MPIKISWHHLHLPLPSARGGKEVLGRGQGAWGVDKVLREWRRCRGSEGDSLGRSKVLGEWRKCYWSGGSARGVEEVQEECLGASKVLG